MNFNVYLKNFLENPNLGELTFFKSENLSKTYQDLIEEALGISETLKTLPDSFYALQFESSYLLFVHLIGAIIAKKKVLILSAKEPYLSLEKLKNRFHFTQVLNDVNYRPKHSSNILISQIELTDEAFCLLSSGSTGPAKIIPLTLSNVYSSAKSLISFFQMNENDTTFLNLPHHHIGGLMILWRCFFSLGTVTTSPQDTYHFISLVPLLLERALNDEHKKSALKKCRAVLIGGAPLSLDLKQRATNADIAVFETYGMTETCSLVLLNGYPLKNQEIKLDVAGHFLIKGPTLSPGLELDIDGFYHTKDVGQLNTDGSFSFLYRSDLLFKSAGELINPLYIESVTRELPNITEAVSVPIKHPEWTNAQVLIYKTVDGYEHDLEIKNHLKKTLHPHLLPRFFYSGDFFKDGIKPARFDLRSLAQEKYFRDLFYYLYIPSPKKEKLIVFFHGFMEDHTDMIPLMDNHQEASFLFIDLPGHGKSSSTSFKLRTDFFKNLALLIEFLKDEQEVIYYGYSMGGRVALELAAFYFAPKLLIVESGAFGFKSESEKLQRLEDDLKLLDTAANDLKAFFQKWYSNPIFGNYTKSPHYELDIKKKITARDTMFSIKEWHTSLNFLSQGAAPYLYSSLISELKLKNLSIVLIYGSLDAKYKSFFLEAAELLPELKIFEIENAGHNPHKTHLSEIKNLLKNFS